MDPIDLAQQRQQQVIDDVLAQRRALPVGLTHCEQVDCRAPISAMRQQLGARLCIDCAKAHEVEARRWVPRAIG